MGKTEKPTFTDRVESNRILLCANGQFPKMVIIVEENGTKREYQIKKTRKGNYLFN